MIGKFITFEGSEGCGKSTQSKLLAQYLKRKGSRVLFVREPGGTKICEQIRKILLNPLNDQMSPVTEMLLYMASRAQIVKEVIKPALLAGKIVISDRFLDSTIAYQGYGLGMDINLIKTIGESVTCGIKPNLTIFLDLAVKKGLRHRVSGKDRIENRSISFHQRVRNGYLKLAKKEPKRIKVVRVQDDLSLTQEKIREVIDKYVI